MSVVYYHIIDLDLLGKEEDYVPYLYKSSMGWEVDKDHILMDRLMGYDQSEPDDSEYKIGCTDVLNLIQEISAEEAEQFMK